MNSCPVKSCPNSWESIGDKGSQNVLFSHKSMPPRLRVGWFTSKLKNVIEGRTATKLMKLALGHSCLHVARLVPLFPSYCKRWRISHDIRFELERFNVNRWYVIRVLCSQVVSFQEKWRSLLLCPLNPENILSYDFSRYTQHPWKICWIILEMRRYISDASSLVETKWKKENWVVSLSWLIFPLQILSPSD